jgi:hypothetical protein
MRPELSYCIPENSMVEIVKCPSGFRFELVRG